MMRKLILGTVLAFSSIYCSAITVDEMFQKYSKAEGVFKQNLDAEAVKRGLKGLSVLVLNDSPESVKEALDADIKAVKDENYDIIIKTTDGVERVLILKTKEDVSLQGYVIMAIDNGEYVLVKADGDLDLSNLGTIMNAKKSATKGVN